MMSPTVRLCAVSDGSFKSSHGTASWRISIADSEDYFTGSLVSPGPSDCQSAYRSELAGLYGIALSLWMLKQFFKCHIGVTIACDGLSALQQFQYLSDVVNPNVPHFDLISATRWILIEVQGSYEWKHVLGHQDDDSEALLDKWATWNIQMDLAAKEFWSRTYPVEEEQRNMSIFGEVGSLWIRGRKVVQDLKKQVIEFLGSIASVPQWEKTFNWSKGLGQSVNWKFFGKALKSVPASRRLWVTKTASGFFASGKMMKLRRERPDAACPRCLFDPEDRLHILQCNHPEALVLWNHSMKKLEEHLESVDTDTIVAKTICWKLQELRNENPHSPLSAQYPSAFRAAFQAQDELGWEAFIFGFWTSHWESIQQAYLVSLNSKVSVKRWATSIIKKLWDVAWDMWDQRNKYLHDKEFGRMVVVLNQEIETLYSSGATSVPADDQGLFRTPLPELLSSPVALRQLWVSRVQAAITRASRIRPAFYQERSSLRAWLRQS